MTTPLPQIHKPGCQAATLSFLGVAVLLVLVIFAGLLFDLSTLRPRPGSAGPPSPTSGINLPAALPSPTLAAPPLPETVEFRPLIPAKGFSNCELYGFQGYIHTQGDRPLAAIQAVVWAGETGLIGVGESNNDGFYTVKFTNTPIRRKLWLQLFRQDVPVSTLLAFDIHIDCNSGFQLYQVDWRMQNDQ